MQVPHLPQQIILSPFCIFWSPGECSMGSSCAAQLASAIAADCFLASAVKLQELCTPRRFSELAVVGGCAQIWEKKRKRKLLASPKPLRSRLLSAQISGSLQKLKIKLCSYVTRQPCDLTSPLLPCGLHKAIYAYPNFGSADTQSYSGQIPVSSCSCFAQDEWQITALGQQMLIALCWAGAECFPGANSSS